MENDEKDLGLPAEEKPKAKPTEFEKPREPLKDVPAVDEMAVESDPEKEIQLEPATEPDEEPEKPEKKLPNTHHLSRRQRFKRWYTHHKKISIPTTVLMLLVLLAAVPFTRFAIAGTFVKYDVQIQVLDSKTGAPVSDAKVAAGSVSGMTSGTGHVTLGSIKPGPINFKITKKYYKDGALEASVPVIKPTKPFNVKLTATGRQVKITITDTVSQKVLPAVDIAVADVQAQTDQFGNAVVVLPVGPDSHEAQLMLKGYNDAKVTIAVSDTEIKQNNFKLTPAGFVYFLSNRGGTIDVMKSNLDGSETKVVLAGTGKEDKNNTVLVASADWKYLGLYANRDGARAKVYVITTSDDKLTTADEGTANFTLYGWLGGHLVYSVERTDLPPWQLGAGKLKSYEAATGKVTTLNQTSGSGDADSNVYEFYSFVYLASDSVIYAKSWTTESFDNANFGGKEDTLASISAGGQNYKQIAGNDAEAELTDYTVYKPNSIYILHDSKDGGDDKFFKYVIGSNPEPIALGVEEFYRLYPNSYFSPDGKKTLWSEQRDGKNAIVVADTEGGDDKAMASLAEHSAFGWFTDKYLLVSKAGSELAILGAEGGTQVKITDYLSGTFYGNTR